LKEKKTKMVENMDK